MSRKESENNKYKNPEIPTVLYGTTDESFYETPAAKKMTRILIEMGREKKKL